MLSRGERMRRILQQTDGPAHPTSFSPVEIEMQASEAKSNMGQIPLVHQDLKKKRAGQT